MRYPSKNNIIETSLTLKPSVFSPKKTIWIAKTYVKLPT